MQTVTVRQTGIMKWVTCEELECYWLST